MLMNGTFLKKRCLHRGGPALLTLLFMFALSGPEAFAQTLTNAPPTRAEILRGALGPLRTCYHLISYHLDVRVDPATQSLKGSNKILFKTVSDFEKMQVDLFTNLAIEKIVFDDK